MKKVLALLFALLAAPVGAQVIPSGPFGSINYWGPSGNSVNLVPGLAGFCLTSGGTGQPITWSLCPGATLASLPSINTNQFYGNVSGNFQAPIGVDVNTILNTVGYDISRPPAVESILYKSNVGPAFNWQTLPPGPAGSIFTSGGATNPPFWAANTIQANLSGICTTIGAVLYFDTPSLQWKCLSPGTSGQLLQTGGAAANPSWLTVTLATLGGVPSTRNINTSAPLGGGGPLSSDLTLTCATCATTTNGGALSATAPATLSAGGVIACATCATTTNGGALSATAPILLSAAGVISMTNQGTTTTVLHGNAAGNPTFGAVAIGTDVSGLGTGVATLLSGASSGTGGPAGITAPQFTNTIGVATPATNSFGVNIAGNYDGTGNDDAGLQSAPIIYYAGGSGTYTNGWGQFISGAYTSCALGATNYPNCTGANTITVTLGGGLRILNPFLLGTPLPTLQNNEAISIDAQTAGSVTNYAIHTKGATTPSLFEGLVTAGTAKSSSWFGAKIATQLSGTSGTVSATDQTVSISASAAFTLTLPDPTTAANTGRFLMVNSYANFAVSSASANVGAQATGAPGTAILAATAGKWAFMQSNGSTWNILMSN